MSARLRGRTALVTGSTDGIGAAIGATLAAEGAHVIVTGRDAARGKAAILLTGLLAPEMAARGHGAIVNLGSINGLIGMNGSALYSATKAAIHSLTKSWAAEYGPSGVRVNTVAPGPTVTEKTAAFADRIAPILGRTPARRASTPEEVARAVAFLASDEASNIHGATLSVDGGLIAV